MDFERVLRAVGLPVNDNYKRVPWDGYFDPVGLVWHHTAGVGDGMPDLVRDGRPGIPGPLCNLLIRPDGEIYVITNGRGNDTGMGSGRVLNDVRNAKAVREDARDRNLSDTVSGNPYFYDIEVEHVGTNGDYNKRQVRSLVLASAAILEQAGWGVNRCIHHRQWSARKIDMSYRKDLWTPTQETLRILRFPTLEKGMERPAYVEKLHRRLIENGAERKQFVTPKGNLRRSWTADTTRELKAFQRKRDLKDDAIVGKRTWLNLFDLQF